MLAHDALEILSVPALQQRLGEAAQLGGADQPHLEGDLLDAGDLQALALLDRLHEGRGVEQRVARAGVEPGKAAAQAFDVQAAVLEIEPVEVGDLELAAGDGRRRAARSAARRS